MASSIAPRRESLRSSRSANHLLHASGRPRALQSDEGTLNVRLRSDLGHPGTEHTALPRLA
eukprot:762599-Hanusia_phi.AAC.2